MESRGLLASIDPSDLSSFTSDQAVVFRGIATGNRTGYSVSAAGDFNGEGFDDVVVGNPGVDHSGLTNPGKAVALFGARSAPLDVTSATFQVGYESRDSLGAAVAGGMDVNGDGFDDLVIGFPLTSSKRGRSFVVFGPVNSNIDLIAGSANGTTFSMLVGSVPNERSGSSVGLADTNNDGQTDILVGSPTFGLTEIDPLLVNLGNTNLIFGRTPFPACISVSDASLTGQTEG